ncbi:magnesium transporter CorA family protein [Proteiniborus sp. MB09-C3]|uniref:magnesium transporter CorA family protein n=1 Tax=Proteiniborus sp. MB09-C3 TaxID=3050072 RepID=UPI002552B4D1|nr:magnesium transporter CorA family protein [Proteiniborus sp. MB09-C3]WIV12974.1 magnesium transporter CorA family protein [Proteiniborus sp. MB09-C3]
MEIYNLTNDKIEKQDFTQNWFNENQKYLVICYGREVLDIQAMFNLAQETIDECIHLDDFVRMESYDDYDYINLNYFYLQETRLKFEEINLYIGENYIVLVLDPKGILKEDLKEYIFQKIEKSPKADGRLNKVYYLIFDKLLSDLFITLEEAEKKVQDLEDSIIQEANRKMLERINSFRLIVNTMKRNLRPLLYIGDQIMVNENGFITKSYLRYFKSIDIRLNKLYDFAMDLAEMVNHLQYMYDSTLSTERNKISERLTIIATFFAPLTVITGIYGMNFIYMPELQWQYGYPIAMGIMTIVSIGLYIFMKKKKWL